MISMYIMLLMLGQVCASKNGTATYTAHLNVTYNRTVVNGIEDIYFFKLPKGTSSAIRVTVISKKASQEHPLLFVARQSRGVNSWSVPFTTVSGQFYDHVSQTLCTSLNENAANESSFYLDISTSSAKALNYSLEAYNVHDYKLSSNAAPLKISDVNPAEPFVFSYEFEPGVERVLVKATSESSTCAIILVQNSQCPTMVSSRTGYSGVFATMTTQAGITVERNRIKHGRFYIVVVVTDTDQVCEVQSGKINPFAPADTKYNNELLRDKIPSVKDLSSDRSKNLMLSVQVLPKIKDYVVPVVAPTIVFGLFYIIALLIFGVSWCIADDGGKSFFRYLFPTKVKGIPTSNDEDVTQENLLTPGHSRNNSYGTNEPESIRINSENSDGVENKEYDWLEDIEESKDIYRLKRNLYVSDMSKKPYKKLAKKFNVYYWNLLTVAVFYALPVIQLVLTYQRVVNSSGDQDICYYNFDCARPYHLLSAFNNVYSNIGYMMLGLLFVFLVMRRDRLAKHQYVKDPIVSQRYGIPQHYGIMYAMGYALFMEGVLSACYHVCPNYSNFQFDTAFMYMIGVLGCLRLYQVRHHDVFVNGHFAYAGFAAIIFTSVIGVIFRSVVFWAVFLVCHVVACFYVTLQIYYIGRIKTALQMNWINPGRWCTKPIYPFRFVLLGVFNAVNWALSINGLVNVPKDFATYLLGIIICNGLLYVVFYVIMKVWSGEKLKILPCLCVAASLVLWGVSISFFVKGLTDWQLSPAESREGNKDCRLLDFYDDHDLWHFLSATAMFFTFMGVLTVDDDLADKERSSIPVF